MHAVLEAGVGHGVEQHRGSHGLDHEAVEHRRQFPLALGQHFAVVGGDHHDQRQLAAGAQLADAAAGFPTVELGHAPVDEHHVVGAADGDPGGDHGQRLFAACRHVHPPAERGRHFAQHRARSGIVVHHQARQVSQRVHRCWRHAGAGIEFQREVEHAALADRALHAQLAAHQRHQALADRQAQAGAAVTARGRGLGLRKAVEDVPALLVRDADAGIADGKAHRQPVAAARHQPRRHHHFAALGELDGVAGQVEQDLLQAQVVADRRCRQRRVDAEQHFHLLGAHVGRQDHRQVAPQFIEAERMRVERQLAGFHLGKVQDVVEQAQQRTGGRAGLGHVILLALVHAGLLQQLQHAQHGVHRRADFVAHIGHELGLGAAGLERLFLGQQQRLAGGARFGAVGATAYPAEHVAVGILLRQRMVVEHAPHAVVAAQAGIAPKFASLPGGASPFGSDGVHVVRVYHPRPVTVAHHFLRRDAAELLPVVAHEVEAQVGARGPHHLRQAFGQRAPARLGSGQPHQRLLQRIFGLHQLLHRLRLLAQSHPQTHQQRHGQHQHQRHEDADVANLLAVPRRQEVLAGQADDHVHRVIAHLLHAQRAFELVARAHHGKCAAPALAVEDGLGGRVDLDGAADLHAWHLRIAVQHALVRIEQHDRAMRADLERGKRFVQRGAVDGDIGGAAKAAIG